MWFVFLIITLNSLFVLKNKCTGHTDFMSLHNRKGQIKHDRKHVLDTMGFIRRKDNG